MPQRGRQRGRRQHAQQGDRAQLTALPVSADVTAPDVPPDPLAQQHGEPPVPPLQDRGQVRAGLPAGPGHEEHAERRLEMSPRPRGHGVRLIAGDAERVGQVGTSQLVSQVQLDDFPLAGGEAGQRRPDHLAELGLFQVSPQVGRPVRHPCGLLERGGAARRPQTAPALVPGHRVQPGAEPLLIAERGKLPRGDDERVLDGVGRVGGFREQGPAVGVQARRITVVGGFESRRVASHDGGHDLTVGHAITLELIRAGLGGFRGIAVTARETPGDGALRGPGMIRAWRRQACRGAVRGRSCRAGSGRRAPSWPGSRASGGRPLAGRRTARSGRAGREPLGPAVSGGEAAAADTTMTPRDVPVPRQSPARG